MQGREEPELHVHLRISRVDEQIGTRRCKHRCDPCDAAIEQLRRDEEHRCRHECPQQRRDEAKHGRIEPYPARHDPMTRHESRFRRAPPKGHALCNPPSELIVGGHEAGLSQAVKQFLVRTPDARPGGRFVAPDARPVEPPKSQNACNERDQQQQKPGASEQLHADDCAGLGPECETRLESNPGKQKNVGGCFDAAADGINPMSVAIRSGDALASEATESGQPEQGHPGPHRSRKGNHRHN